MGYSEDWARRFITVTSEGGHTLAQKRGTLL